MDREQNRRPVPSSPFVRQNKVCQPAEVAERGSRIGIGKVNTMAQENGLVQIASAYSVEESVQRLQRAFAEKGLQVFAVIDHNGEAEKVGLTMRPTKVLIFGSPKGGTPLMVAAPSLAIDLPLKALAWQDEQGKVWLSYNSPEYLQQRHGFPADLLKNIAGIGALIQKAVE